MAYKCSWQGTTCNSVCVSCCTGGVFIRARALAKTIMAVESRITMMLVLACVLSCLICNVPFAHGDPTAEDLAFWQRMARYSSIAYQPVDTIMSWSCAGCTEFLKDFRPSSVVTNEEYGTQAYTGFDSGMNAIVVAFRGTNNNQNWKQNLNTFVPKGPYIYKRNGIEFQSKTVVHRGFFKSYMSVRDGIMASVAELLQKDPDRGLVITGHSLGGAMATLSALDLAIEFPDIPKKNQLTMVNFGSPGVGNAGFALLYDQYVLSSIRVVNPCDPVPRLPPGTTHVQTEYRSENPVSRTLLIRRPVTFALICHGRYLGVSVSSSGAGRDVRQPPAIRSRL